jgi:hypothetical protein
MQLIDAIQATVWLNGCWSGQMGDFTFFEALYPSPAGGTVEASEFESLVEYKPEGWRRKLSNLQIQNTFAASGATGLHRFTIFWGS